MSCECPCACRGPALHARHLRHRAQHMNGLQVTANATSLLRTSVLAAHARLGKSCSSVCLHTCMQYICTKVRTRGASCLKKQINLIYPSIWHAMVASLVRCLALAMRNYLRINTHATKNHACMHTHTHIHIQVADKLRAMIGFGGVRLEDNIVVTKDGCEVSDTLRLRKTLKDEKVDRQEHHTQETDCLCSLRAWSQCYMAARSIDATRLHKVACSRVCY